MNDFDAAWNRHERRMGSAFTLAKILIPAWFAFVIGVIGFVCWLAYQLVMGLIS